MSKFQRIKCRIQAVRLALLLVLSQLDAHERGEPNALSTSRNSSENPVVY